MENQTCNASHCETALVGDSIAGFNGKGGYCDQCWLLG